MELATRLFVRLLGLCYLVAFVSFGVQASGLLGSQGILPAASFLEAARDSYGSAAWWQIPSIFWLSASDSALRTVWILGVATSLLLLLDRWRRPALLLLVVLYLSICAVGQDFFSFQWDVLLLEAGFLAIFLDAPPARVWLFRWLLFRLMFMSGAVKFLSHDSSWRNLTALSFHYETQPLPTPLAWYLYHLPMAVQKASTLFVLVVELAVPFLIFGPRRLRQLAGAALALLQVLILLTGNYTFFNWLTLGLCLFLFDDAVLGRLLRRPVPPPPAAPGSLHRRVSLLLACLYFGLSGLQLMEMFTGGLPEPAAGLLRAVEPLRIVNTYGLFAVMTTTRPEIVVEGSGDGESWRAYEFLFKPGDLRRAPPVVAPYQPRLDWQMWFAALSNYSQNRWFVGFMLRLLQGSPPVLRLLAYNPFPDSPPRYIRAVLYDYRFTTPSEKRASGDWWRREPKGTYFPPVSLRQQSVK